MSVSLVKRPKPQGTLWVCVDCLMADANGEDNPDQRADQPEPWALEDATDVTMGLLRSAHDCDGTDDDDSGECGCETREFSWSACDGCGSTLGGSRHAYTWWA